MLLDIIKQINWFDIVVAIMAARIIYMAITKGFVTELFKLIATVFALFFSMQYYIGVSDYVFTLLPEFQRRSPIEFLDFLAYLGIVLFIYIIVVIIRLGISFIIKAEIVPWFNKWGAFILGLIRAYLFIAMFSYLVTISSVDYLRRSVAKSYSGIYLFSVALDTYGFIWNNFGGANIGKYNDIVNEIKRILLKAQREEPPAEEETQ